MNSSEMPDMAYLPLSPPRSDCGRSPPPGVPPSDPTYYTTPYPLSPPATDYAYSPPPCYGARTPNADSFPVSQREKNRAPPFATPAVTNQPFQITVKDISGRVVTLNDITLDMKISRVKEKLEEKEAIPPHQQRLLHGVKELNDEKEVSHYKIEPDSTLYLVFRLPGGCL